MLLETGYDHVFHAQRHFRAILDSVARPGTVQRLDGVDCRPPGALAPAGALVGFALLNADVGFHLVDLPGSDAEYLTANTHARPLPIAEAAFIFCRGTAATGALEGAHCGTLTYPDTAATVVVQVESLSSEPLAGGLALTLEGPGVPGSRRVFARGLGTDLLLALQARNLEFPMGLDALVVATEAGTLASTVVGLPRTTRLTWERC